MDDQEYTMADNIFKLMEQSELDVIVPDITDFSLEDLQDRAGLDKDDEGTTLERAAYLPGRAPIYLRSSLYFGEFALFEKTV